MTTKTTDIVAALIEGAEALLVRGAVSRIGDVMTIHPTQAAQSALLRSLADACKAYREDWEARIRAVQGKGPLKSFVHSANVESALLALARGETPNNPEHTTDG